jgi:NitT/TauT family transport system substrate-binding protein
MNQIKGFQDVTRRKFVGLTGSLAVAFMVSACASATPSSTETSAAQAATGNDAATTVRLAYFPNFTHAVGLVGVAQGTFQKALGENVKLDVKSFNAGPALIEALLAGEVDLGYVGPNPAINGYVKSRGEALRVIVGASSGGAFFVVRPEANIKTAKDLDGKKLATPQKGGTQDVALRHYLKANGLKSNDEGGTVSILPTQNPDILTLFRKGELDGAWVPEPWGTRLLQEANGQLFIDERDQWPDGKFITTVVVVSGKFLKAHPDLVKKFLAAHVDVVKFIQDKPNDAKVIVNKEIERITTKPLPEKVIDAAFKNVDFTFDPLAKTLFVSADYAFDLGFLGDSKPDLSGLYDMTLLNEVLKEKGLPAVEAK